MTGGELVVHILQNGLVDKPVYDDGTLLGFINPIEAAIKFDVGAATIDAWIKTGQLEAVCIGNMIFIPANVIDPRERIQNEKDNRSEHDKRVYAAYGVPQSTNSTDTSEYNT